MQEEVESRTVNLAISTSKLTARTIVTAVRVYMLHRETAQAKESQGKQSVKDLIKQGQGVTNIDISKTDLKGFERVARKYGIDYAVRKDISENPPKYLVFFKARDASAMMAAFNEYSAKILKKDERPSVIEALKKLKEKVAEVPGRIREKIQERGDR